MPGAEPALRPARIERATVLLAAILAAAVYALHTGRFFPTEAGTVGHDYQYFLPLLLNGVFWIEQNGWGAAPVFTPAFCGGLPMLANPQSVFYSLPQLLGGWVDPLAASHLTLLTFAGIGAASTYLLLARRFRLSPAASGFGAIAFLFNGFLAYRMAIGHLTFHGFALVPVMALVALTATGGRGAVARTLFASATIALCLAYGFYAGGANSVVPNLLAVLALWLVFVVVHGGGNVRATALRLGLGAGLAVPVAMVKLAPAIVFVGHFPRAGLPLALYDGPLRAVWQIVNSLFVHPVAFTRGWLGEGRADFGRHEFEFGVGAVCLVLLLFAAFGALRRRKTALLWLSPLAHRGRFVALAALIGLLALPLALTVGGPGWNEVLKSLPYVQSHYTLIRWWAIYVPIAILLAALAFDDVARARSPAFRTGLFLLCTVALLGQVALTGHGYYRTQSYDPGPVLSAYEAARAGLVPPIGAVGAPDGGPVNDALTSGISALPCYEPLFGYHSEGFPESSLRAGPAFPPGRVNLANPACYIYGEANRCEPGDLFAPFAPAEAQAFASYRPFETAIPAWQGWARLATLAGLGLCALFVAALPAGWLAGRLREGGGRHRA